MNRKISILTLFALLMNLVACAGSPSNTDTNPQTSDDTTATQADSTDYAPTLPKVDMKEETYTVFSQGWWGHNYLTVDDISVEDINGDVVNDAVYRRKGDIEEEYNCIIEHHNVDDPDTALKDFNTSVMAGDNSFDIALMRSNVYNTLLSSGSLLDLSTVPNVNLTAPYYDPQSYTDLAIADKHCGIVSNITMQSYMSLFSVYFNKVMHCFCYNKSKAKVPEKWSRKKAIANIEEK